MNRQEQRAFAAEARRLIGRRVRRIEFPGGKTRNSVRLLLEDGTTMIATRRRSGSRGDREVAIMRALHAGGARVPKVLAYDGRMLIQQDLGQTRLSERINAEGADPTQDLALAVASMAGIQTAARAAGLAATVPVIGTEKGWVEGLVARPDVLGMGLGIPTPDFDREGATRRLNVREPSFVKWDSRPGNALIAPDGEAWWFDWEHCGARNGLDDMVWLLADEFVPGDAGLADRLIGDHLPTFEPALGAEEARAYFRTMALFHSCVRLEMILRRRMEGKWWSMSECLAGDRIGVTRTCALRLLGRAGGWAAETPGLAPLAPWFADIGEMVEGLD